MKNSKKLNEILSERVLLADGAMGTMLYQQGVFLNTCFDELNITHPALVKKVHDGYVQAGCDFIETNTFGANEFKLAKYGLADKVEVINSAAVKIAKEAAGDQIMVAGAIGPLGIELREYSRISEKEAKNAFSRQAQALANAGVDFLILETFSSSQELIVAIDAVSQTCDLPIIAQMTCNESTETIYGEPITNAIAKIAQHPAVTAVGLNCSLGPSEMLESLALISQVTDKPISVQPNAGLPRQVEGRMLYMCTPEYMAEYAKRFYEKGAKIIGGCCGTTPEHLKIIVSAVKSLDKAAAKTKSHIQAQPVQPKTAVPEQATQEVPFETISAVAAKIAAGQQVNMIEITPPRGVDFSATIEKAKLCAQHGIDAINLPDGPRASSRLSPMVTALKIQELADIETVLHFCCRDRNLIGMQSDLLGASAAGLKNILIITGDPPKMGEYPDATAVFDMDSVALTSVLKNLNRGIDIGGKTFSPPTALTIGVGANPVATDIKSELEKFKRKVDAGAQYAITQPVFDVRMLFEFLEAIEDFKIPVIAGIWPFTSYKNAEFMANEVPGVVVPVQLLTQMQKAQTKEQGRAIGIEIAQQMVDQIKDHVAGFAVSAPFGNVKTALAVLGKIEKDQI